MMSATIIPFPQNRHSGKARGKLLRSSLNKKTQASTSSTDGSSKGLIKPQQASSTSHIKVTIKLSLEMSDGE